MAMRTVSDAKLGLGRRAIATNLAGFPARPPKIHDLAPIPVAKTVAN
jgi:hypothetical protein